MASLFGGASPSGSGAEPMAIPVDTQRLLAALLGIRPEELMKQLQPQGKLGPFGKMAVTGTGKSHRPGKAEQGRCGFMGCL